MSPWVARMTASQRVLIITGTCGSGKSTAAGLLSEAGWARVSEDDIWPTLFGRDRGPFGSSEHRAKRRQVHDVVFRAVQEALDRGDNVVIDATMHETPPEAFLEYTTYFDLHRITWILRILHPSLEVAIARDAGRDKPLGAQRVADLHAKFTGKVFPRGWFIDTSTHTPSETVARLLRDGAA
jgi:adenylate kinase family enzyme